jgi:hypothetical protein
MIDLLGFRNLLEGRIPRLFYDVRLADIKRRHLNKHAGHWCNGLILQLLQITHRQWTFRNGTVHLKGPDGLTPTQTKSLARRCEDLLWTDPSTLLNEDKYLLEVDFDDLGNGASTSRQMWISEMEAASVAARSAGVEGSDAFAGDTFAAPPVPVDTEGSIRFRRRRRRRSGVIEYTGYSISRSMEEVDPLWPRLLLCGCGKERLLPVAVLNIGSFNDLLGWILDISVVDDEFKSQPCKTIHCTHGQRMDGLRCCELSQSVQTYSILMSKVECKQANFDPSRD